MNIKDDSYLFIDWENVSALSPPEDGEVLWGLLEPPPYTEGNLLIFAAGPEVLSLELAAAKVPLATVLPGDSLGKQQMRTNARVGHDKS